MFTLDDLLDIAVQIEENGERAYRMARKTAPTNELKRLFEWLADQEVAHANQFRELKNRSNEPIENAQVVEMGRQLLRSVLGEQSFALHDANLSDLDRTMDLIDLSVEFERDTRLFYELLKPFVESESAQSGLQAIIDEETEHIHQLKETRLRHPKTSSQG